MTNYLNPQLRFRFSRDPVFRSIHRSTAAFGNQSASEKLLVDAVREEDRESNRASSTECRLTRVGIQHQNWTGEESVQDAVLRMLVDKYKPLRSLPIRSADLKLKESLPQIRQSTISVQVTAPTPTRPWERIADMALLPSTEGHKPWHTTFKAPAHASASIKLGNFPPSSVRRSTGSDESCERTRQTERELAKRKQQARRLSHARESTLDYKLGLRSGGTSDIHTASRINPVSLKGWQSLIEERIEVRKPPEPHLKTDLSCDRDRKHGSQASSTW